MLRLFSWVTCVILLFFNLRRLAFLLAAAYDLVCPRPPDQTHQNVPAPGVSPGPVWGSSVTHHVLILVPLRNEARSLPGLLAALLALDYPPSSLTIGLIDDGSTDGSGRLIDEFASSHAHVVVLHHPTSLGKANALNGALRQWSQGDLVMVYDADARPRPNSLRQIVAAFDDPMVAGAGGLIRPRNGLATPSATYSALERLVHQQVTQRAKDRLDLAPALLGSHCAYRRRDLEMAGGFPSGALLEDSHLTVMLARQGRKTRFLPNAVATDQVPETLRSYWRQHVRWGRGFHDVALRQAASSAPPRSRGSTLGSAVSRQPSAVSRLQASRLVLRLELWMFALGYLDRLALLMGFGLLVIDRVTRARSKRGKALAALVGVNLILPYVQIALTLVAERASLAWWLRLSCVPFFFVVDIAAAAWSILLSLARRPRVWQQTERQRSEEWTAPAGLRMPPGTR